MCNDKLVRIDGQKIAKKLSRKISKESSSMKCLLSEYNEKMFYFKCL